MGRSHMLSAVLQTIMLSCCAQIISHHLLSNAISNASNHELWLNITTAFNASVQANENRTANFQPTNGTILNGTVATNATNGIFDSNSISESFYWKTLPRHFLFMILFGPLYYYWHIWLERFFPARPRVHNIAPAREKAGLGAGDGDNREEEIVQKWIAQGKVRRASLSWWNTFLKWLLNITVATLWSQSLDFLIAETLAGKSPIKTIRSLWGLSSLVAFFVSFLNIRPLASLIGFIVVPAHRRMPFEAGANLVWMLFFGVFARVVSTWLINSPTIQHAVGLFVESMNNSTREAGAGNTSPRYPRIGDEL